MDARMGTLLRSVCCRTYRVTGLVGRGIVSFPLHPNYQQFSRMVLSVRGLFWTRVLEGLLLAAFVIPRVFGQEDTIAPAKVDALDTRGASRDQLHVVPMADASGHIAKLRARICRPAEDDPARLVVINHGSPRNAVARPTMQLGRCDQEAAQWFLKRGYVVVFALRRGYGQTGGDCAENYGGCARAEYVRAGIETARDIDAVVNYATALPFIKHDGAIVVGQSAGGWGTIAYDALPHPRVGAFVVMAGGRGGHENGEKNENCHPERLVDGARSFGKLASTPMLWIYAENDSFFAPSIARAMWRAFTTAGGNADLKDPGPFDEDGHRLFFGPGGSAVWGPLVEQYLAERIKAGT
jgi:dienelactone hydrolase